MKSYIRLLMLSGVFAGMAACTDLDTDIVIGAGILPPLFTNAEQSN